MFLACILLVVLVPVLVALQQFIDCESVSPVASVVCNLCNSNLVRF